MEAGLKARIAAGVIAAGLGVAAVVSPEGLGHIKRHEGLSLVAYPDALHGWKVPTICYGATQPRPYKGQKVSLAECDTQLAKDVKKHCAIVDNALRGTKVVLTQGEVDAYCSFAYNTGYFKTNRSGQTTAMYRNLIAGDNRAACAGLLLYTAGSDRAPGLKTRRQQEYSICMLGLDNVSKPL